MGDLQGLIEKVREAELKVPERKMSAFLSGRFTLMDMYDQFESMKSIGPLRHILKMIPGVSYSVPEEMMELAEDTLKKWRVIIQSMTPEERIKPKILSSSRIRRVARGSGTKEKEVKELLSRYNTLRKMMKTLRRKKFPLFGRGLPLSKH
jgi:signal recognition particle subunit SRP54